jgi:fatty acid desaturase
MKISHGNGLRVPAGPRINRKALHPRVRPLMRINNLRSALEIVYQWSLVLGIAGAVIYLNHPVAYLIGMILMATRQHAFLIVMHDAVHHCMFTSRFANEYLADMLLGMPINFMLRPFRAHHLAHHRLVGSEEDPDAHAKDLLLNLEGLSPLRQAWAYARFVVQRAWMYLTVGTVLSLLLPARKKEAAYTIPERIALLSWVALWLGVVTWFGLWFYFLVLWVIPFFFLLPISLHIRGRAEHDMEYSEEVRVSRYVEASILERIFICPNFINYHAQHHLHYHPGLLGMVQGARARNTAALKICRGFCVSRGADNGRRRGGLRTRTLSSGRWGLSCPGHAKR